MSAYYGAAVGGYSPRVICHKIQIEGYTRRLKNGKIVNVNGYVSSRDAAEDPTYARTTSSKGGTRQSRDSITRANIANAKSRFSTGISRAGRSAQSLYRTTVGGGRYNSNIPDARERVIDYGREGLRNAAGAAVDIAGGYAKLVADKIGDVMADGYNAFKSAISTAGSAIAKAFNAGKSFIEGIIGSVKDMFKRKEPNHNLPVTQVNPKLPGITLKQQNPNSKLPGITVVPTSQERAAKRKRNSGPYTRTH